MKKTIRDELAIRLKAYWRVYRKRPDSYNACLGLGKVAKGNDRPFNGWSIDGHRYQGGQIRRATS